MRIDGVWMSSTMQKIKTWTLWSRVILILLLVVDIHVYAESSYDGDVKGCTSYLLTNAAVLSSRAAVVEATCCDYST